MAQLRRSVWAPMCFGLLLSAGVGCKSSGITVPFNDPATAFYCASGYVFVPGTINVNAGQVTPSGCIPQQTLMVQGVVTDSLTTAPLPNVQVTVFPVGQLANDGNGIPVVQLPDPNTPVSVQTDINGYFVVHGVLTTSSVLITYNANNYFFQTVSVGSNIPGPGGVVLNGSVALKQHPARLKVAGVVYGGDGPATNVLVQMIDDNSINGSLGGLVRYSMTTDANGRFEFDNVFDTISYTLRVLPYDRDGDGVSDYRMYVQDLGVPNNTALNWSNLVVPLTPVTRSIAYTNLLGVSLPVTISSNTCAYPASAYRLATPTSPIVLQFTEAVNPNEFVGVLRAYEGAVAVGANLDFSEPLPYTASWSPDKTAVTITPTSAFVADDDVKTGDEFRINALVWSDGVVFVPDNQPTSCITFPFDVGAVPQLLASPAPSLYYANKATLQQTPTQVSCDSTGCWYLDAANGYISQYDTPAQTTAMNSQFNTASGFQLTWPAVHGAKAYKLYARQQNTDHTGHDFAQWYQAAGDIATTILDPTFGPVVYASNVLSSGAANTGLKFNGFGLGNAGPLAAGNKVDIAVTAVDYSGYESAINASSMLTLQDTTLAALDSGTVLDYTAGAGPQANTTEQASSQIHKELSLVFDELMDTTQNPNLAVIGGFVTGIDASASDTSWSTGPLVSQNLSTAAVVGPVSFTTRGACTALTCTASTAQPDHRVCVADASVFGPAPTGQKIYFVDNQGTLQNVSNTTNATLTLQGNPVNNILEFTVGVYADLGTLPPNTGGIFACAAYQMNGQVAVMGSANTGSTLPVNDASIFYVGETVNVYDLNQAPPQSMIQTQIQSVNTKNNSITLAATPGALTIGSTFVQQAPLTTEYSWRPLVASAQLKQDTIVNTTVTNNQLNFDTSLAGASSSVMVGDLILIDLDGVLATTGDRYFQTATEVVMDATGSTDYHVIMGAPPAGLTAVPNSATIVHNQSLVWFMGDAFQVTGVRDSSGNAGVNPKRDHASACTGTPQCVNGAFYY